MKKLCKETRAFQLVMALLLTAGLIFAFGTTAKAATPKPAGVKQIEDDCDSVKVSWDTVFGLNGYVCARISPNPQMDVCQEERVGYKNETTEHAFYGLNSGKTYYVQIGTHASGWDYTNGCAPADVVWSDAVEVVTRPNSVEGKNITVEGATETSITVSWKAVEGATSYRALAYNKRGGEDESNAVSVISNGTSAEITGLQKNVKYMVKVLPQKTNSSNTYTTKEPYDYGLEDVPTLPTKITGVNCERFDMSVKKGVARFAWDENPAAVGYQYEIYKYNGNKVLTKGYVNGLYQTVTNSKLKTRQVYKIRVRGYINKSNGEKVYGAWSDYEYFCRMAGSDVSLKKSGSNKLKTSWKKVTGATGYTIYLGTSSGTANVKYKKVGTTKKNSYTIKTKIKKGKYYYVRVIPNYKKGKKTYSGTVNEKDSYSAYARCGSNGKCYYYN